MENPQLYAENSQIQKFDANEVLQTYFELISWGDGKSTLADVGCATGDVINELLLPLLPDTCDSVTGIDISKNMIEFAKARWNHPKVAFRIFDITSPDLPPDLERAFDHVFSFYCINWTRNQQAALNNINKMLKNTGDFFVTVVAYNPIFTVYYEMIKNSKWKPYMANMEEYVSLYHHLREPHLKFRQLLNEAGFSDLVCETREGPYVFSDVQNFENTMMAVNPFIDDIPDDLKDSYRWDYMEEMRKLGIFETREDGKGENVRMRVNYVFAFAKKVE